MLRIRFYARLFRGFRVDTYLATNTLQTSILQSTIKTSYTVDLEKKELLMDSYHDDSLYFLEKQYLGKKGITYSYALFRLRPDYSFRRQKVLRWALRLRVALVLCLSTRVFSQWLFFWFFSERFAVLFYSLFVFSLNGLFCSFSRLQYFSLSLVCLFSEWLFLLSFLRFSPFARLFFGRRVTAGLQK